jgi:hypothetical protein
MSFFALFFDPFFIKNPQIEKSVDLKFAPEHFLSSKLTTFSCVFSWFDNVVFKMFALAGDF